MNTKAKGTRNEHRSIEILESAGYSCMRAGASLGVFDVIGIGANDILLVQVKTGRWPGSEEIEAIELFPCPSNCRKLVHRWDPRQRLPRAKEIGGRTK